MNKVAGALCGLMLSAGVLPAFADADKVQERLTDSAQILDEVMAAPDKGIPTQILAGASCVVVIPSVKKAAFIVGGQYGQGVATCKTRRGWSAPVFVKLTGGSVGFQVGAQATDLVLVAMNQQGLQSMLKSKFKIGGAVSAAAGPVGRTAQAGTDWKLNAQFLTYSRAKGAFLGIDLNGDVLDTNKDDMEAEYGPGVTFPAVLRGSVPTKPNAQPFVSTVAKYFVRAKAS